METLASQRTVSSRAFLKSPFRLLEKVTCRFVEFSILLIWIFPLAMFMKELFPSISASVGLCGFFALLRRRKKIWERVNLMHKKMEDMQNEKDSKMQKMKPHLMADVDDDWLWRRWWVDELRTESQHATVVTVKMIDEDDVMKSWGWWDELMKAMELWWLWEPVKSQISCKKIRLGFLLFRILYLLYFHFFFQFFYLTGSRYPGPESSTPTSGYGGVLNINNPVRKKTCEPGSFRIFILYLVLYR